MLWVFIPFFYDVWMPQKSFCSIYTGTHIVYRRTFNLKKRPGLNR